MVLDVFREDEPTTRVPVQVRRLDNYLADTGLDTVSLVKIDTEGFEFPVLFGMSRFLDATAHRPPMIVEIVPWAAPLLEHSLSDGAAWLAKYGYRACRLDDARRGIDITQLTETTDVLLLPSDNG